MGIFGRKKQAALVIDPGDLVLPDEVPTGTGTVLRKLTRGREVHVDIVGESFRQEAIRAIHAATGGRDFEIYLRAEQGNPYDKNAVMVIAGEHHIGYLSKDDAKAWRKFLDEAVGRGQFLSGWARAKSRDGQVFGVFGYILMPNDGPTWESVPVKELTAEAWAKAALKVTALADSDDPETPSQLRAFMKKAQAASAPFASHVRWLEQQGEVTSAWGDVESACREILDGVGEAIYATDADDVSAVMLVDDLAEAIRAVTPVE